MKLWLSLALLLLCLLPHAVFADDSFQKSLINSEDSITMRMLRLTSNRAKAYAGGSPDLGYTVSYTMGGHKLDYYFLNREGYAESFKETGGPLLYNKIGINFKDTILNPSSFVFICYTALLTLMVGFAWFRRLNEVSKGKGSMDVIPFILKLLVGLIVAYNIPLVYSIAMTVKDIGLLIVVTGLRQTDSPAQQTTFSAGTMGATSERDEGIRNGIETFLNQKLAPLGDGNAKESGRARLVALVAMYNSYVRTIKDKGVEAAFVTPPSDPDSYITTSPITGIWGASASESLPAQKVYCEKIDDWSADLLPIEYVGFTSGQSEIHNTSFPESLMDKIQTTSSDATEKQMAVANFQNVVGGKIKDDGTMEPLIDSPSALISLAGTYTKGGTAHYGCLKRDDACNPQKILASCAPDVTSALWLRSQLVDALNAYMRNFDAFNYHTSVGAGYVGRAISVADDQAVNMIGWKLTATSFVTDYATFHPTNGSLRDFFTNFDSDADGAIIDDETLGDNLFEYDSRWALGEYATGDSAYRDDIAKATVKYLNSTFFNGSGGLGASVMTSSCPEGFVDLDTSKGIVAGILGVISDVVRDFARACIWVVHKFWTPCVAALADFIFNIIIEFYVYILWLAYPFWFHDKTSKAFTGALNTLVSVSCTAATFALMIVMFDGFTGYLLDSVLGNDAYAIAMGVVATFSLSAFIGIAFGYAIFYIIGTFKCFTIAPKVFQAFLAGSNVITPMIGAVATAAIGGLAGAVAGTMLGAKAIGGLKGSAIGQSVGKGVGGLVKGAGAWVGDKTGLSSVGQKLGSSAPGRWAKGVKSKFTDAAMAADTAISKDGRPKFLGAIASDMTSAKHRAANAVHNPKQALASFAKSPAAALLAIGVGGMLGDPTKMLGAVGGLMAVQRFAPQGSGSGTASKPSEDTPNKETDTAPNTPPPPSRDIDAINNDVASLRSNYTGTAAQQAQKVKLKREVEVEIETTVRTIEHVTNAGGDATRAQAKLRVLETNQRRLNDLDRQDPPPAS